MFSEAKSRIYKKNKKIFTCVLWTHFKEVLDVLFTYSFIKRMMWYLAACKIWILVGVNDMNYDADRSNDIYSCFQADKYMYKNF